MDHNLPEVAVQNSTVSSKNFLGSNFENLMKVAEFLAKSDLIPAHFQGKPANVFIALEVALRHNMSPFAVMQSLYVVHGRPGFEGKFLIALANQAGWNIQFDIKRDQAGNIVSCTAYSDRNGVRVYGPTVTAQMVKAEGWDKPKGNLQSKWATMPELMYRYRAGAYFVNTVCPEIKMGLPTVEELEDMALDTIHTPITGQPEEVLIPEPDYQAEFERLVAEWNHPQVERLPKYIEAIIAFKKCDRSTVIQGAVNNWDKFTAAFDKWLQQNSNAGEEEQENGK